MSGARHPLALVLSATLALAALAGCGGGDGGDTTSGSMTATARQGATAPTQAKAPSKQKAAKGQQGASPNPTRQRSAEGDPTPGAKAVAPGVPTTKGGDNSIQAMGTEGQPAPRAQAVDNLSAYLAAFSAHEWSKACSLASGEYRQQLSQLVANAKTKGDAKKPEGCAATLAVLFAKAPKGALGASRVAKVLSFRTEGDHAFLIYRSTEGKAMFIAMKEDEGEWKVNVLQPEPFSAGGGK